MVAQQFQKSQDYDGGAFGPFNLQPLFQKGVEKWFQKSGSRDLVQEIWFKKSGSRKMILQTWTFFLVREKWLTIKKGGFIIQIHIFSGWIKVVDQKKNLSLKNHFS